MWHSTVWQIMICIRRRWIIGKITLLNFVQSEGASNEAIADKLDIGISVVKRCLNKFKENGVEASLRDNNGRGRCYAGLWIPD